jgi:hypothetical protein
MPWAGFIWRSGEATPSRNAAPEDESADRQSAELAGLSVPAAAAVPTATEEEYYKHDDEKCRGGHVASSALERNRLTGCVGAREEPPTETIGSNQGALDVTLPARSNLEGTCECVPR